MKRVALGFLALICVGISFAMTYAVDTTVSSTETKLSVSNQQTVDILRQTRFATLQTKLAPTSIVSVTAKPTITALPLMPKSQQFPYDNPAYFRSLYAIIPEKMGTLQVETGEQAYMSDTAFVLESSDGNRYVVEMLAHAYLLNNNVMIRQTSVMQNPQAVDVGDEAYVSASGLYIATMRYRNMLVTIEDNRQLYHLPTPTATPLPVNIEQWTQVLRDIKAWLDHGVLP